MITPEQKNIVDCFTEGSNIVVDAVAGSGKTYLALEAASALGGKCLYTTFNKHNVVEMQERAKKKNLFRLECKTLHALGYAALKNAFPKITLNEDKYLSIFNKYDPVKQFYIKTLLSAAYAYGIKETEIENILPKLNISYNEEIISGVSEILKKSRKDFSCFTLDELVYIPSILDFKIGKFPSIIIDEYQDLNPAAITLIYKILYEGGTSLWLGDPYQTIYGFNGAGVEAREIIYASNTKMQMSTTYRCPVCIVNKAKQIVPYIKSAPNAINGIIQKGDIQNITESDIILCRNIAPLFELAVQLGGAKIDKSILQQAQKLLEFSGASTPEELDNWASNKEHLLDGISVARIALTLGGISILQNLPETGPRMSTVHKAKGLEADVVYIYRPELMPSKLAIDEWQIQEEKNILYIAWTRTKDKLYYL